MTDRLDAIERLGRLRDQGLLTDEEFAQEKARVLASSEPEPKAATSLDTPAAEGASPVAGEGPRPDQAAQQSPADDNDLMAPLRPITTDGDASGLVRRVWVAFAALVMGEVITAADDALRLFGQADSVFSDPVGPPLAMRAAAFAMTGVVLFLISRWAARRASRIATVILIVLAVSALVWPFIDPEPTRLMVKVGTAALAGFALWYLIGVARGAFWLNGRRPLSQATPARGPGELKMTMADARAKAAPVRRLIGWIGLVWLVVFLLGGVWFWLKTNGSTEPSEGTSAANAQSGPPSSGAAGAPADQLQQILTGTWVEEGAYCASYMALRFASDGQVYAEGTFGTWAVRGSQLDISIQSIDMDQVAGPVAYIGGALQLVNRDEFHLLYPDGSGTRYRRCVGDQEPWRAPQTTTGEFHPLG
jgi:hypothetical protein